jgi:hypothetical protein
MAASATPSQVHLFTHLANPMRIDLNRPNSRPLKHQMLSGTPFIPSNHKRNRNSDDKTNGSSYKSRHSSHRSKRSRKSGASSEGFFRKSVAENAVDDPPFVPPFVPLTRTQQRELNIEKNNQKIGFIQELNRMQMNNGVTLTKKYTETDPLEEIEFEYNKQKQNMDTVNAVAFMKDAMKLALTGIELANQKWGGGFLELEGWSSDVTADMGRYENCLSRLYKKYWRRGSVNPLVELGFLIIGSGMMHHFKAKFFGKPKHSNTPAAPMPSSTPFNLAAKMPPNHQKPPKNHNTPSTAQRPRMARPVQPPGVPKENFGANNPPTAGGMNPMAGGMNPINMLGMMGSMGAMGGLGSMANKNPLNLFGMMSGRPERRDNMHARQRKFKNGFDQDKVEIQEGSNSDAGSDGSDGSDGHRSINIEIAGGNRAPKAGRNKKATVFQISKSDHSGAHFVFDDDASRYSTHE